MNEPSALDIVSRNMPVAWFVTVTVTPGSTAPWSSTTRPRNSVVPCCAAAAVADSNKTINQLTTRNFIEPPGTANKTKTTTRTN